MIYIRGTGITAALVRMECGYRKSTHINRPLQYFCSHQRFAQGDKIQKETNPKNIMES